MGIAIVAFTVATRDPDGPFAVGLVAAGAALATGALAAMLLVSAGTRRSTRGLARNRAVARGLRRGVIVGCVVALGIVLRAVDGLTLLTAVSVVAPFVVAEAVLSARRV